VGKGTTEHTFDFAKLSGHKNKIQWAAFLKDCQHTVKPVLEGHRVTVSYTMMIRDRYKRGPGIENYRYLWFTSNDDSDEEKKIDEIAEENGDTALLKRREKYEFMSHYVVTPGPTALPPGETLNKIYNSIKDVEFPAVGLCLLHNYSFNDLRPDALKGVDRTLYEYFVSKIDVKVHLLPILLHIGRYVALSMHFKDWVCA